jgi:hypothetical protein
MDDNVLPFRPRPDTPAVELTPPTRRASALATLELAGDDGITWRDLATRFSWHHGVASSVLSVLHKEGKVRRLAKKRDGCGIYVHPDHVHGRAISHYGSSVRNELLTDVVTFLATIPRCTHDDPRGHKCRSCQARVLHARITASLTGKPFDPFQ